VPRPIKVRIARVPGAGDMPLPQRMTEHASGFDLPAAVARPLKLKPRQIAVVPCGFCMALPQGYEAQVRPRSGLSSKHGITLINSPGTIDCDYRGQVQVPLVNLGSKAFVVTRGMRIAQMVIMPVPKVTLVQVKQLKPTGRGAGGFGHTGH